MIRLRVVLDTNVLVSGSVYPASLPGGIIQLCRTGALDLVLSHYILNELARVLPRLPRFHFNPREIDGLLDSLRFFAAIAEPASLSDPELRDPTDQQVLATFLAANADYLITGDKDLLALADRYRSSHLPSSGRATAEAIRRCFLLPASCFLLPASCFLLPASKTDTPPP